MCTLLQLWSVQMYTNTRVFVIVFTWNCPRVVHCLDPAGKSCKHGIYNKLYKALRAAATATQQATAIRTRRKFQSPVFDATTPTLECGPVYFYTALCRSDVKESRPEKKTKQTLLLFVIQKNKNEKMIGMFKLKTFIKYSPFLFKILNISYATVYKIPPLALSLVSLVKFLQIDCKRNLLINIQIGPQSKFTMIRLFIGTKKFVVWY